MSQALAEYDAARQGEAAWMLGRFIVPASRADELADLAGGDEVTLSVIVDTKTESRGWIDEAAIALSRLADFRRRRPALEIAALEIRLPPLERLRDSYDASVGQFAAIRAGSGFETVDAYLELPFDTRWRSDLLGALRAMARSNLCAKIRCGGAAAPAFPAPYDVAAFVIAAREEGVPYKATAGLHHPFRHYDKATGFMMHGFLNLLAAAAAASQSAPIETIEEILADEIADDFVWGVDALSWRDLDISRNAVRDSRRTGFRAYGSCSFAEPLADMRALRLL